MLGARRGNRSSLARPLQRAHAAASARRAAGRLPGVARCRPLRTRAGSAAQFADDRRRGGASGGIRRCAGVSARLPMLVRSFPRTGARTALSDRPDVVFGRTCVPVRHPTALPRAGAGPRLRSAALSLAWQQGCAGLRGAGAAPLPIRPGVGESGHAAAATQDICDARARRCGRTAAGRASAGWAHAGIPVDPGCADHCGVDALRAIGQRQPPAPVRLLVDAQHGGVELDLFAQTEGGGEAAQIGQDLPMRRVVGLMARHGMADECR